MISSLRLRSHHTIMPNESITKPCKATLTCVWNERVTTVKVRLRLLSKVIKLAKNV